MIYTASWRSMWDASKAGGLDVTPVRISRGKPKFWPAAAAFPAVDDLMPDYWMFGLGDEFEPAYRKKLARVGFEAIRARLEHLEQRHGDIALCCFEAQPADCHRSQFSRWWAEQGGQPIREWEPNPANIPAETNGQLSLAIDGPEGPDRGER